MKKLLLVNKKDEIIGYETKEKCHQGKGLLHRAFSVYIFNNKGQLLIQQRSRFKNLWPLYWANSCCSHSQQGENYTETGEKRLKEELGFTCPLKMVDKFQYQAQYKNVGSENEFCAILVGEYNSGQIKKNYKEVVAYKWVDINALKNDFKKNPYKYAPWLKIGLKRYLRIKKKETENKKEITLFLKETAGKIDPIIQKLLKLYIDKKFHGAISYQISTGGKRLRPALTIISCKLLGGKTKDVLFSAAGLEILHNCTLIVDDIIDHSRLRRKKPTTYFKFGKSVAECMNLDYLAAAFEGANRSKNPVLISEIFARTIKTILDGEIYDILFEQQGREDEPYVTKNRYQKIAEREYYKMVAKKTATLFQSCCEVGGICAGANKKQLAALKNYSFNLGMAFQIQDDILDIFGEEKNLGKKIGKDIEERKLGNIVILFALSKLPKGEKKKILEVIRKREIKNKDINKVIKLLEKSNSQQEAFRLEKFFIEKAKKNLEFLPQNKWNKILENFADFIIQRNK